MKSENYEIELILAFYVSRLQSPYWNLPVNLFLTPCKGSYPSSKLARFYSSSETVCFSHVISLRVDHIDFPAAPWTIRATQKDLTLVSVLFGNETV